MLPAALAVLGALVVPGVASAAVTAPHNIISFPQRDFVSASGYTLGEPVTVSVTHVGLGNGPVGAVHVLPVEDPTTPGLGLVEVNHPGGACWNTVTPDIHFGDTITITNDVTGAVDTSVVRNVTAGRPVQTAPGTLQVHGTAGTDPVTGARIDVAQIEQRLVAPRSAFAASGARTLRATTAPGPKIQGTLSYDSATGADWTATYTGLSDADMTLALSAESRGMWIDPAVPSTESTIFENGAAIVAGPAAPCAAPLEKLPPPPGSDATPPSAPSGVSATVSNNNTVALSWTAATDNVGVVDYGVYRDGIAIATVQSTGATAPAPTTFVDKNVPPGTYTYTVDAGDAIGNRSTPSNPGADAATTAAPAAAVAVHEPPASPIGIISFPSRDFISSSGYLATDTVDVSVIRGGKVVSTANGQIPQDDPTTAAFDGTVEVNHPGGGCWEGVTPELRPGDVVREVAYNPDGTARTVDQTRTSNVSATGVTIVQAASTATSHDGVVEIHGTAEAPNGKPLPLDQIEQRLVANRDLFEATGKRTLRAPGNGTMTFDTTNNATGTKWTARYEGLSSNDVYRAAGGTSLNGRTFVGSDSRVLWLGANPLSGQELTIFEQNVADPPGPVAAFCTAPIEAPDTAAPSTPTSFAAAQSGPNDVKLTWTPSSDDWYVAGYRVLRDGKPIADLGGGFATATDSTSAFTVPSTFVDAGVPAGTHAYALQAFDNASPRGAGATPVEQLTTGRGNPYGNVSQATAEVTVTQADVTAPTVPANLVATVPAAGGSVTLTWSASNDDVGVTGYGVYRRVAGSGAAWEKQGADLTATTFAQTIAGGGAYEYTVDATDVAGNRSAKTDPPATANTGADSVRPSDVTGLAATNSPDIHGKDVKVSWTAASDNIGVTGYGVYRDGVKVADVNAPALSWTDVNRPAATYKYTVDAVDSAGNRSLNRPAAVSVVVANDPPVAPHDVIAFAQRDFISATGYTPGAAYTFSVLRGGKLIADSTPVVADATGLAEVNHPGGACWNGVTPNIQPGDVVRITNPGGVADQTTVPGVTDERPIVSSVDPVTGGGTVEVHGTAQDGAGNPLPIDQIEQRLIANRDSFDLNNRRTLRAGGGLDGTLAYDAAGSIRWTAKYTVQTPNDLARAVGGTSTSGAQFAGSESRILWNGRAPLALNEQTIYENGPGVAGGPAGGIAGCTSGPAETPAPGAALSAAPTFAATAVGSQSAAQDVTLTNTGTAPLHVDRAYVAGLNPGDFTITANTADGATVAPNASVKVSVAFKPTVTGTRQANVSFADDAANTTDQTVALVASTPVTAGTTASAPVQSLAAGASTVDVTTNMVGVDLRWTGNAGRYELQMATGANTVAMGAFKPVTLTPDTATSANVKLDLGATTGNAYQFQVRGCSGTTCGAWAQGPKFTLVSVDDKTMPAAAWKGTWTSEALAGSFGGTVKWAAGSAQATLVQTQFTVSGNAAWISTMGPDRGQAQVQIDGGTPQVIDLYSQTLTPARVVWARDALPAGNHTITVTVLGKKSALNPGACSTGTKCARVDVDGGVVIK